MTASSIPGGEYPRRFVPAGADLAHWATLGALFDELERRGLATPEALLRWLADWDELGAAADEERARRFIASDLQKDDSAKEKARLFFIEEIEPKL
ncbi:MAG: M3 family oligoendopeptidase, partial [bacterium]